MEFDEIWKTYFKATSLVQHQIDSYNYFLEVQLPQIFHESISKMNVTLHNNDQKTYLFEFSNFVLERPKIEGRNLLPLEAITRGLTYEGKMFCDITFQNKKISRLHLLNIPIMVKCKYCHLFDLKGININDLKREMCDELYTGGYFIIRGQKKTVLIQERMQYMCPVLSVPTKTPKISKYSTSCEIRSCHDSKLKASSTLKTLITKSAKKTSNSIDCQIPFYKNGFPSLIKIFRLYGVKTPEEMIEYVKGPETNEQDHKKYQKLYHTQVKKICSNPFEWSLTKEQIYKELATKKDPEGKHIDYLMMHEILPAIGIDNSTLTVKRKLICLGEVARLLILASSSLKLIDVQGQEHIGLKRFESCGLLIGLLFRQLLLSEFKKVEKILYKQLVKQLKVHDEIDGKNFNLETLVSNNLFYLDGVTEGLRFALATGNWGKNRGASSSQQGVSQLLNQNTPSSTLSHLRRTSIPINRDGKSSEARQVHTSNWGITCPAESPEGKRIGLLKNLALFCQVINGQTISQLCSVIESMEIPGIVQIAPDRRESKSVAIVYVNGCPMYELSNPDIKSVVAKLRKARQVGVLSRNTSIYVQKYFLTTNLHISCRIGTPIRTIVHWDSFVQHSQKMKARRATFVDGSQFMEYLFFHGILLNIDKNEENEYKIAPDVRLRTDHPYIELMTESFLSIMAAQIPFIESDQTVRAIFQCSHGKAAIGISSISFQKAHHAIHHYLWYPQIPVARTRIDKELGLDQFPAGANPIVAVKTFDGNNVEDAVILNQSALDRGLFRTSIMHTYPFQENGTYKFAKQGESNLDLDGLPANYKFLKYRDKIMEQIDETKQDSVPKTMEYKGKGAHLHLAQAHSVKMTKPISSRRKAKDTKMIDFDMNETVSRVDQVILAQGNKEANRNALVRIHIQRVPKDGDKFSSRHGQKGVMTMALCSVDMPFTSEGIIPDMIVNPHMLPSRMTVGDMFERLFGKRACSIGQVADGSPFQVYTKQDYKKRIDDITTGLLESGYSPKGKERLICGKTGKMIEALIFIGPIHYQRLTHQGTDKIHARNTGPRQPIIGQPTEKRSRNSGQKLGEMEKNCLVGYGAMMNLKDRLHDCSDFTPMKVCSNCGTMLRGIPENNIVTKNFRVQENALRSIENSIEADVTAPIQCFHCDSYQNKNVAIPQAFSTLLFELNAMGIDPKIQF